MNGKMVCQYCEHEIPVRSAQDRENVAAAMKTHDDVCAHNPIRIERDKLREQVEHLRRPPTSYPEATSAVLEAMLQPHGDNLVRYIGSLERRLRRLLNVAGEASKYNGPCDLALRAAVSEAMDPQASFQQERAFRDRTGRWPNDDEPLT